MEELVKETALNSEGVTIKLAHDITVKIKTVKPTMKIMMKGFNPIQDDKKIEECLINENKQLKFIKISRHKDRKG